MLSPVSVKHKIRKILGIKQSQPLIELRELRAAMLIGQTGTGKTDLIIRSIRAIQKKAADTRVFVCTPKPHEWRGDDGPFIPNLTVYDTRPGDAIVPDVVRAITEEIQAERIDILVLEDDGLLWRSGRLLEVLARLKQAGVSVVVSAQSLTDVGMLEKLIPALSAVYAFRTSSIIQAYWLQLYFPRINPEMTFRQASGHYEKLSVNHLPH